MRHQGFAPRAIAVAVATACASGLAWGQAATPAARVEVIGVMPLPGVGLLKEEIPAAVQTAGEQAIARSGALDLSDFMNRSLGSVHMNEVQNNPFQPDLNYRGYTASPLLGTPQGLSVYMDGVRLNQPFGDVVSWDLIPKAAIANLTLMPGSNPLFGLNTLGGAISVQTKDGLSHPGTAVEATLGSYGRRSAGFEHGGANDRGLHWFVTGQLHRDRGWRDDSPSEVRQLFGKLGWKDARTDLAATVAYADNRLNGNGLQEQALLSRDYSSVYTKPDITDNRSLLLNLSGKHAVSDSLQLSGNAWYRRIKTSTFNGDINEDALDQSVYQPGAAERAALTAAGYAGFPTSGANASNTPFPSWRCIANVLLNDEPAEKCNGLINRTRLTQENYGLSGQATLFGTLAGQRNQFTAGAAFDASKSGFSQTTQLGYLNPDRSVTGLNAYGDGGVTGGDVDGEPYDTRVQLNGRTRTWSLYFTDTLSIQDTWHLTLSGRYNRTQVRNDDLLNPGGGANSLDGRHTFSRFNPAIGLAFTPSRTLNAYLGYNEGSRTPTAIELGCANPDQPCKLPNAMAGDPPLKQVVTKTWEAGVRGRAGAHTQWSAGVFRATNQDDILFVADDQAGYGYFKNFGKTRRQGVELGLNHKLGPVTLGLAYTYLEATYQSHELVNGSSNSSNLAASAGTPGLDGAIAIQPGNHIPLIPRHLLKLSADYDLNERLSMDLEMQAVSGSYARGNENNQHQPDSNYYQGRGKTGGYAVFNLGARFQATPQWRILAQVNNLFDRKYSTAAQLGTNGFTSSGAFIARPFPAVDGAFPLQHSTFYAPGAPRTFWVGVRYAFEKARQ